MTRARARVRRGCVVRAGDGGRRRSLAMHARTRPHHTPNPHAPLPLGKKNAPPQDSLTGEPVTSHRAIAANYLRGWFAVDFLATFPVEYVVRAAEVRGAAA